MKHMFPRQLGSTLIKKSLTCHVLVAILVLLVYICLYIVQLPSDIVSFSFIVNKSLLIPHLIAFVLVVCKSVFNDFHIKYIL